MNIRHRADHPTAIAPDGAEIRDLIDQPQGARNLSMAEALVREGQHTTKVYHRTTYEEIWYVVQGTGTFHLHPPGAIDEETAPLGPGDAVLVPPRFGFWVENTGAGDFIWLCCGSPAWSSLTNEAQAWPLEHSSSREGRQ